MFFLGSLILAVAVIWKIFRSTSMFRFICKFGVEVLFELWIEHHDLRDGVFVFAELILEKFTVFCIDAGLEFVCFNTPVEAELEITEQIGHLADI